MVTILVILIVVPVNLFLRKENVVFLTFLIIPVIRMTGLVRVLRALYIEYDAALYVKYVAGFETVTYDTIESIKKRFFGTFTIEVKQTVGSLPKRFILISTVAKMTPILQKMGRYP